MNVLQFQTLLNERKLNVQPEQLEQFNTYYKLLIDWNQKINLTAITEQSEVYEKHFFDSIAAAFFFDFTQGQTLVDIGAGAGFPSLPIKILFPHLKVTIIDSLNKRISFLNHLSEELGLKDINAVHGRAEDLGVHPDFREKFDFATARAVARLNILAEYCLPFVTTGGSFIVLKGSAAENELDEAKKAINILGAKTKEVNHFCLPSDQADRTIITIDKKARTPKEYPRKAGVPAKKPIV